MTRPLSVTVRAPAKVNLELRVGAPREDGFHELATVFQALSLADDVTVRAVPGSLGGPIPVTCEGGIGDDQLAAVPLGEDNLAVRAARLLARTLGRRRHAPGQPGGLAIHLHKRIPVAGGMAGGSADAAAALLALDHLWQAELSRGELVAMAARLGSDVPFPLYGGTAVGVGRGEQVGSAMVRGRYPWVLALSRRGLSTPAVFAEIDRLRAGRVLPRPRVSDAVMAALRSGNLRALGSNLANDLQPAAVSLRPELEVVLQAGRDVDALGAVVSGSGPTVAFLATDGDHAAEIDAAVRDTGLVDAVVVSNGPAPGARVTEVAWPT